MSDLPVDQPFAPGQAALWLQFTSWGAFLGSVYARVERITAKRVSIRVFNDSTHKWERKSVRQVSLVRANDAQRVELEKLESYYPPKQGGAL